MKTNPKFYKLISKFKESTGCKCLINTSFNVRGEPIVCTPQDAYRCFMRTQMDILVLQNQILYKSAQPKIEKDEKKLKRLTDIKSSLEKSAERNKLRYLMFSE